MKTLFAILIFISFTAQACDSEWINLGGVSQHLSWKRKNGEPNEVNPGLGYTCRNSGSDWAGGVYKNTVSKPSFYLLNYRYIKSGTNDIGVAYGAVTGYVWMRKLPNYKGVSPIGMLRATGEVVSGWRLGVNWIPRQLLSADLMVRF